MTDLRHRLAELLSNEPPAPYDIDRIVAAGRRAQRRRGAALATAGTLGVAGLTAAVVIPVTMTGGGPEASVGLRDQPSPTPSPTASSHCEFVIGSGNVHRALVGIGKKTKASGQQFVETKRFKKDGKTLLEVCPKGTQLADAPDETPSEAPAGPPYRYTEEPSAIAARLGAHLHDKVTGLGLTITYTRPFAQESTTLESGHPPYFTGNVDVHETNGYGDIGVQVMHKTTQQVAFDGSCTAADHCDETTLPDGSVLRTGQVDVGRGDVVLTAEVHRPDGVVVQAQESNYPFGPDAGTQAHGDQPLTLDQLASFAEDTAFTF